LYGFQPFRTFRRANPRIRRKEIEIMKITVNLPTPISEDERALVKLVAAAAWDGGWKAGRRAGFMTGGAAVWDAVTAALDGYTEAVVAEDRARGPLAPVTAALDALRATMTAPRVKTIIREGGQIVAIEEMENPT
jgi:hypothetical protein